MKLSQGRGNVGALLGSLFKRIDKSRDYFKRKYKMLVKFYLRFYRRRHHTVVGQVLTFRGKHAVIVHNVLRIRGGLGRRRRRTYTRVFYGLPITTRPIRTKKKKKKQKKLPLQLQNVSSTTRPAIGEPTGSNTVDENIAQKEDAAVSAPAAKSIVIVNSEKSHASNGTDISKTAAPRDTTPPSNEFDENSTNNIWNLDLATVALEMTDENLKSFDDDELPVNTTGSSVNNISTNEPVSTSTPILTENRSLFQLPVDRQASPVEDINEKLRRQLKLLKMGKAEKTVTPARQTPIITRISLRRNTIAAEPVKPPFRIGQSKSNEISTKSLSQDTSPEITTNGSCSSSSSRNSIDATQTAVKETASKSKIAGGLIDSLFNRLKSLGEQQVAAESAKPSDTNTRSTNKRRSNTPLNDAKNAKTIRTSLDRAPTAAASSSPLTVREMLQIKRMREQEQQEEDDDNVSTCSSSNADFLGFDVTNKNIDVSALLPTPRVPKSSKESVFVSEDLDAFMKENSLENVANVEIIVPAKVGDVDEALITDAAQPPTLTIPERPVDMQRPRTLAEKRLILQRQKDVHYQMIEHESTVYHELKKRVKMGSFYRNQHLRGIQDAEIPFTRDCWRATCWINTDNNYFFYRTIACGANELKLAGGRGNNKSKLFCELPDDVDDVKPDTKPRKCKCPSIGKIKINNYDEHRQAIAEHGRFGDTFPSLKMLNNLKREYIRPCPLSKKPKAIKRTSLDIEYGQLELLTIPTVQLEVWSKIGEPMPDNLKPLMKTIMPEGNLITTEWAEFAVSVLVAPKPSPTPRPQKQQRKFKRPAPEERKSFIFDIPYVNNQTRIIVRRRRHPLAANSRGTRDPIEAFYESDSTDFEFSKKVDRRDVVASKCADVLSAMIESVALTLNESNFIRNDPDLDYVGKLVPIKSDTDTVKIENDSQVATIDSAGKDKFASTAKMDRGTSKLKVMKELKRLNVTIINAVPDEKPIDETKREECKNIFCRMGCVCESISKATTISNHCSNTKCMFVCKCSSSANQPHFNVPVDLLHKDLGNLHARATARLAKEEKDFTSTIVVSDHDMFVLPNSVRSTKRNTKKPKRYNECLPNYDSSEELDATLPAQSPPKRARQTVVNEYAYDQTIIDSMRHVTVHVPKLPELDVEPWCMIHCLYKCYCDGTAIVGKPFSFTNANATDKAIDDHSNHVIDETAKYSSHWESIPPRRRQYSFDRSASTSTSVTASQMNEDIAEQRSLRAARTRMFRWQIERTRCSRNDVRDLRRQCDEVEYPYQSKLNEYIQRCKQHFLRETWKSRSVYDQKRGTNAAVVDNSDDIQFVSEIRVPTTYAQRNSPETSVTQLNRIITNTMRTVCAIQRRNLLKLNTEPCKMSIVRWDRMLAAFKQNQVFVWDTLLTDDSSVLLLTTDANNSIPINRNIRSATNIRITANDRLPLVAQMLKMAVKNEETTQLAVLLFRLSTFWRVVGVMHSDKHYIHEGLHASPSADENPALTKKIDHLHKLLIQRQKQASMAQAKIPIQVAMASTPTAGLVTAPATDVVTARSNLTLENLQNINESQLQLLLPIPLSQDQRWLMMTLGTDFTHIWLPQWRKFLSYKRIRSALMYAAQTRKTIELSPPDCHPSVFATSVRSNQIFVGPYHMNEPQKLALFYRHADGRMLLSENYAKLSNVPQFLRRSIGSWIYTSVTAAAATNDAEKVNPTAAPATPTTTSAQSVNTQQTMSHLKIQNVYSINNGNNTAGQSATKQAGQSILKPMSVLQNASINSDQIRNQYIRMFSQPSTVRQVQNVSANTVVSSANATVISAKESTSNAPIIITKVTNQHQQQKMPVIASIRSYGEAAAMNKFPVISSILSGKDVQQSLIDTPTTSASPSTASEAVSEPVTLVEVVAIADATPSASEHTSEHTSNSNGPMEIINLSDDDDNDESVGENYENDHFNEDNSPLADTIVGYIICRQNKDLGKIPAEIVGNSITLRIGSCDKEAELPLDLNGNESFDCLNTVDKYMSQLITNIAYSVHPKNLLLKWKFCPETSDEHKSLPIHSTKALNSYSVVFKDNSVSIQSNYSARTDVSESRKYILDVEKLASQILPRNVAKELPLKAIIEKATIMEKQLEAKKFHLAGLRDRYSRTIAAKNKMLNLLQVERKALARANGPE